MTFEKWHWNRHKDLLVFGSLVLALLLAAWGIMELAIILDPYF